MCSIGDTLFTYNRDEGRRRVGPTCGSRSPPCPTPATAGLEFPGRSWHNCTTTLPALFPPCSLATASATASIPSRPDPPGCVSPSRVTMSRPLSWRAVRRPRWGLMRGEYMGKKKPLMLADLASNRSGRFLCWLPGQPSPYCDIIPITRRRPKGAKCFTAVSNIFPPTLSYTTSIPWGYSFVRI